MGSLGVLGGADDVAAITMQPAAKRGGGGGHQHPPEEEVDWERYGLTQPQKGSDEDDHRKKKKNEKMDDEDDDFYGEKDTRDNDLFAQDQSSSSNKPWWKSKFFLSEPSLFGTWDGVFTTCMINIFGVIVFLRSGWMVAEAGIGLSVVVILTAVGVILVTVFAAVGICSRCQVERGGVYFIVSHILGARFGGAIGVLYCFGQSVGCAINIIGFGKSMDQVFRLNNVWIERSIGAAVLVFLIALNLIGVTRVIKVQFVLLLVLLFAALDFTVGSFVRTDPVHGVDGYYSSNFWNNSRPSYSEGESWFTVFGVFFPTLCGILAGINMSGDLRNPSKDIPVGTLSAVGASSFLYLVFILVLGATCQRSALYNDFMITEKVSAVGFLLLAGLYISSLSSCLGGLYGTPRVLQTIACENVVPFMRILGRGRGPNKVPVIGTLAVGLLTLVFVLVGDINMLGPVVTMPFLLTYAATDYAYFSLAMTFDMQRKREERMRVHSLMSPTFDKCPEKSPAGGGGGEYGSVREGKMQEDIRGGGGGGGLSGSGGNEKMGSDLDTLFPERTKYKSPLKRQYSSQTSTLVSSPDEHSSIVSGESARSSWGESNFKSGGSEATAAAAINNGHHGLTDLSHLIPKGHNVGITEKPHVWYNSLSNRWLSLLGVLANLSIMFLVQWIFALVNILLMWLIFFYISRANPGVPPGIAEFKLFPWLKYGLLRIFGRAPPEYDQIVVTPMHPGVEVMEAQLTEDNADYAARERYHQSRSLVPASNRNAFEDD